MPTYTCAVVEISLELFPRVTPRELLWENKMYKLKRYFGLLTPTTEDIFFFFSQFITHF